MSGVTLRVLRLCSVFEPDDAQVRRAEYDPIGGMQNHTASLTRALDGRGVTQIVLTSRLGGPTGSRRLGRDATVMRVGLPIRRFRQAWALGAARAAASVGAVDLIHAHQGEDLAVLPLAASLASRRGCPLVVTLHCSLRYSVPPIGRRLTALRLLGGAVEEFVLDRADAVIALTRTTGERLADRQRTVVLPSGVEPALFDLALPSALLAGIPGPRLLYVGRLAQQKDVPTLVRAFGLLRQDASLVIIGDGPDQAAVDAAVATLPAERRGRVYRFGFRPHSEVPALLAAADVVALPSVYEEMGSVLVEALQAGVPVVASAVGGIPDVVRPEGTGLLVPPRDPERWAVALDRLLASPEKRARMQAAARREADRYAWPELAGRVLELYGEVLAARSCSTANRAATRSMS